MCARSRSKGHTESLAGAVCLCVLNVFVWSMSMYAALFVILGSCTCSRSHSVTPSVLCGNRHKLGSCFDVSLTVRNK